MDPTLMQPQQQQQAQPMQGGQDLSALLQRLTPEQLHQLMGLSGLDEQGTLLEQQLARAHAMRKQASGAQSYGALAGLGNGLAAAFEGIHERKLENEQKGVTSQKMSARDIYANLLRNGGADQQQSEPPELLKKPSASASVPFQW